ncbi:MAG: protein-methionine-sulfoxide reductase heme-binding subunit MsrQ [Paracoccaceae bacterium]|nr:protein-methionine-sulfoxide reductase heme-binding subunit MsrQ [Paracoccaceae bacterium]
MAFAQTLNGRLRRVPTWPVYLGLTLPFLWLVGQLFTGGLGVDPTKALEHEIGLWGLRLIVAGLCITPIRRITGVSLLKYRRAVGLMAFFYVVLHLLVWLLLDIQLRWDEIWADILKRPYITLGMIGFTLMIPLAFTSNALSIRTLGAAAWGRLHRLTYAIAVLGAVHYLLAVKAFPRDPLIYLTLIGVLLALRLPWIRRRLALRPA